MICIYTNEAFLIPTDVFNKASVDFVCFENQSHYDGWIEKQVPSEILSFSSIRREKIIKILPWKYLPEYDYVIWCESQENIVKAVSMLKTIIDNPYKDVYLYEDATAERDFYLSLNNENLNLKSQLEKYSKLNYIPKNFHLTDIVAFNSKSQDFKNFSIKWMNETLKESLNDEVSFSWLLSISNLNVCYCKYEIDADCFFKIVIPNYNNGNDLEKCINSILSQNFKSFKIVIVDDCSTDNSLDVAKQFAEDYPDRIFFLSTDERSYSGKARNVGIDFNPFTSKYTWFVDGDDRLFNSSVLSRLYEKASIANADLISFDCVYVKNNKSETHKFEVVDFSDPNKALLQFGIAPWHRIVKTEKVVPFFENCIRRQDLATVFRQYSACSSFAHLNEICYFYNSCDYANLSEAIWSLQSVWVELKRQIEDNSIKKEIRDIIVAYLNRYPKIFGKFEEKDPREQKIVAMASYPPRKDGMMKAIKCLLPQCDYLCLYLNEYTEVPEEIHDLPEEYKEKLSVKINGDNLKDYGKFYWFGMYPGYYFTVDDDLTYPEGYCDKLVKSLKDKKNNAVVGMHGNDFTIIENSFVIKKTCHPFNGEFEMDEPIDCIGTGAACFYPNNMDKNFRKALLKHYDSDDDLDMSASILAKSEGKMLYRIASEKNFVDANGSNLINPLANIHLAWEKRYLQYDLWLNRKSENKNCVVSSAPFNSITIELLDELKKIKKKHNEDGVDFYFVPIEERAALQKNDELYFMKFEFVKFFVDRYSNVSISSLDNDLKFDFNKDDFKEILNKIYAIKNKKLKRMNDKILKANLSRM